MTLKRSEKLQPVVKLAGHREKTSAKNLGNARSKHSANQNQLQDLLEYRESYSTLLQNKAEQGISSGDFCIYQNFLFQLDNAISQQKLALTQSSESIKQNVKGWKKDHIKQQAMNNMKQKLVGQELKSKAKNQQKQDDDEVNQRSILKERLF
jgi:flagellar FliJ protein